MAACSSALALLGEPLGRPDRGRFLKLPSNKLICRPEREAKAKNAALRFILLAPEMKPRRGAEAIN